MGDPSPEAWNRVRRYASWMRQVSVDEWSDVAEDTFRKLRLSSPPSGWFPALQDLSLRITEPNVPYADLLFSPHLKTISIYMPWSPIHPEVSRDDLAAVASNIPALPTSTLQSLSVRIRCSTHLAYFKDSLSSVVLRCGPSLTELTSQIPLSDATVNHLIRLPHLHTLRIENPPPDYSTSPLPLVFPPLTGFTIGGAAARGWISLFERLEGGTFAVRTTAPLSRVKNSLNSLIVYDLVIDISFTSSVQIFRNLVNLCVGQLQYSRQEPVHLRAEQRRCLQAFDGSASASRSFPRISMSQKHLRDDCYMPPFNFRPLHRAATTGNPLQYDKHHRRFREGLGGPPTQGATPTSKVHTPAFVCRPNAAHPRWAWCRGRGKWVDRHFPVPRRLWKGWGVG